VKLNDAASLEAGMIVAALEDTKLPRSSPYTWVILRGPTITYHHITGAGGRAHVHARVVDENQAVFPKLYTAPSEYEGWWLVPLGRLTDSYGRFSSIETWQSIVGAREEYRKGALAWKGDVESWQVEALKALTGLGCSDVELDGRNEVTCTVTSAETLGALLALLKGWETSGLAMTIPISMLAGPPPVAPTRRRYALEDEQ
jgi:hypothetical protein